MSLLAAGTQPLVKVCGLTRAADVDVAIDAGANLLGFVSFPDSPRHLSDQAIVTLVGSSGSSGSSGPHSVLVVVDGDRARIDELVRGAKLDAVQLCGTERPADWRDAPYPILRRLGVDDGAPAEIAAWADVAEAFILDHPATPGGSGRGVDPVLADRLSRAAPCLLAGGLDADVLLAGLPAPLDPACLIGYDASSRLEVEPGEKDPDAVRHFVQAARSLARSHTREQS